MTKSEKREAAIRHNPKQVRFRDLDLFLRSYDFMRSQPGSGSSHYHYRHPLVNDVVTIPSHGTGFVKEVYVRDALQYVDRVKERMA